MKDSSAFAGESFCIKNQELSEKILAFICIMQYTVECVNGSFGTVFFFVEICLSNTDKRTSGLFGASVRSSSCARMRGVNA
jgi:hypothetical protein